MSNCVISTVVLALFVLSSEAVGEREEKKPGGALVKPAHVVAIQREAEDSGKGRYDWGPSVMRDGELYKMWWVRLGGGNKKRFPYSATLPDGEVFSFTYPDWGDRVYYAESRDGLKWNIAGEDYAGPVDQFGPDAPGPMMVLKPAESEQEKNHLGNPSVIKVNDTYYMYYETCCEYDVKRDASGKVVVGNEYHNQVFVATSRDGRTWRKHPDDANPQPIVEAPEANRLERKRYGFGQPSVFYKDGTFVMHYVNSCTGPGDFMVRIEADNPFFRDAKVFRHRLMAPKGWPAAPAGAVAPVCANGYSIPGEIVSAGQAGVRDGEFERDGFTDGVISGGCRRDGARKGVSAVGPD